MSDDNDKTVFGQPLPPQLAPKGRVAMEGPSGIQRPPVQSAGHNQKPSVTQPPDGSRPLHDPWQQAAQVQRSAAQLSQPPLYQQQVRQPIYRPGTGAQDPNADIFPEIAREKQPAPVVVPQISLAEALRATEIGAGGSSNPILASASNLITLLGRLRTGVVETDADPLLECVTREIDNFERNVLAAGVRPEDARDAKYSLSATADDIVQNLPGADRSLWVQYSMAARFFGDRSSGVGFFRKVDEAMKAPGQRFHLLELMLTCLSLGFEGQYRTTQNGSLELARIRTAIYETLRRVTSRPDDDISPRWMPVALAGRRLRGEIPTWMIAAVAGVILLGLFAIFLTLLTRKSTVVYDNILAMHAGRATIAIERTEPVLRPYLAESVQLERIRSALASLIADRVVEVDRTNEWVFVRLAEVLSFKSGSAELTSDFTELAAVIGASFNAENGPIRVVGHTDSIPGSGRGRYKTNQALSEARAQTVASILAQSLEDPTRVSVEGMGAVDPIGDNATEQGRARNRRVEIMIMREN